MFKKENSLDKRIKRAVEASTPEIFPVLLQQIEEGEDKMKDMLVIDMPRTAKKVFSPRRLLALAASLLLVFGSLTAFFRMPQSTIGLDVNPSLELVVSRFDKVLRVNALNEEGQEVLGEMKLKNVDMDLALNALVGSMVKNGYIDEMRNSILITVESKNENKAQELQEHLTKEVNSLLDGFSLEGSVLSQLSKEDDDTKEIAEKFGLSLGKAALIKEVTQANPKYKLEDLAGLPINDIKVILESKKASPAGISLSGQASTKSYIGVDKAKTIALNHAGVKESDISKLEIELDLEDGQVIYEVEFYKGQVEYEYEISATSGKILEYKSKDKSSSTSKPTSSTSTTNKSYIGVAKAEELALAHVGLSRSSVRSLETELEREDGRMIYEVEFYYGNKEYEIEMDAYTGEILEVEIETKSSSSSSSSSSQPSKPPATTPTSPSKSYIGAARAEEIALDYVGVLRSSVRSLETELEREDGRMVYEVEFYYGDKEYEIEMDAYTGEILEVEIEVKKESSAKSSSKPASKPSSPPATSQPSSPSPEEATYISATRAEDIALGHAGLSRSQIRKLETEVDHEDGRRIWEVEFKYDIYEYEYEIDAITGAILEWEKELD